MSLIFRNLNSSWTQVQFACITAIEQEMSDLIQTVVVSFQLKAICSFLAELESSSHRLSFDAANPHDF